MFVQMGFFGEAGSVQIFVSNHVSLSSIIGEMISIIYMLYLRGC